MAPKTMSILIVAVLLVAFVGGFFLLSDDSEKESEVKEGRLTIYGNANNDDYIDDRDVDFVQKILDDMKNGESWDSKEYPYADSDYDGDVDSDDLDYVKKMVDRNIDHVYYLNANFDVDRVRYPITSIVSAGSWTHSGIVTMGLSDITYGCSDSVSAFDEYYWIDLIDKYRTSPKIGQANTEKVFTLMDMMRSEDKTLDCIITTDNSLSNEQDFINAGLDVLELPFGNDNEINAYLILGFLTQREERSHQVAEFYDDIMDKAKELGDKHSADPITAVIAYGSNKIESSAGDHDLTHSMCIKNVWQYDKSVDSKDDVVLDGNTEWLSNPEWNGDYVIGQEKPRYAPGCDEVALWKEYVDAFGVLDAVPENLVILNCGMFEPIMVAYMLEIMYPDEVEKGYGDAKHQYFIDSFINGLSGWYNVETDGTFCITYDDVKDKL